MALPLYRTILTRRAASSMCSAEIVPSYWMLRVWQSRVRNWDSTATPLTRPARTSNSKALCLPTFEVIGAGLVTRKVHQLQ